MKSALTKMSQHPEVQWTERQDKVYVMVMLDDAKNVKVNLHPDSILTFSRSAPAHNKCYELKLELFAEVAVEESIIIGVKRIFCILMKAEKKWWNKLLRGNTPHYVKFVWDKWLDGDDDGGPADVDTGGMEFSKFGAMAGGLGADSGNMGSGSNSMVGGKEQEYNPSDWPDTIDSYNGFNIEGSGFEDFGILGEFSTETLGLGADIGSGSSIMGGGKQQEYNPNFWADMMDSDNGFDIEGFNFEDFGIVGEFSIKTLSLGDDSWNLPSGSGSMGGGKEQECNPSDRPGAIDSDNVFDIEGIDIVGEFSIKTFSWGDDSWNLLSASSSMGGGKEQDCNPCDRPGTIDSNKRFDIEGFDFEGTGIVGEFSWGDDSWNLLSGSGSMGGGKEQEYNPW